MTSSTSSFRSFVIAFAVTLASVFVAFGTASEVLVRTKVIPNHNFYRYLDLFVSTPARNAIFGDSLTEVGITGVDGFVNLAYGGDGFSTIAGKIRLFFHDRDPDRVIIGVAHHQFSVNYLVLERQDSTAEFGMFVKNPHPYPIEILNPTHRHELFAYWRQALSGRRFEPAKPFAADGARLAVGRFSDASDEIRRFGSVRKARILEPVADIAKTPVADTYRDIVRFLVERNATVCLVDFPVAASMRPAVRELGGRARASRFFRFLANDFPRVRYVDYVDMPLGDEMFVDYHHLNADGARKLSAGIAKDCFS